MLIIPAPRTLRQEDGELEASLNHITRTYLRLIKIIIIIILLSVLYFIDITL